MSTDMNDREALLFVIDRGLEALDGEGADKVERAAGREMKRLGLAPQPAKSLMHQYLEEMRKREKERSDANIEMLHRRSEVDQQTWTDHLLEALSVMSGSGK